MLNLSYAKFSAWNIAIVYVRKIHESLQLANVKYEAVVASYVLLNKFCYCNTNSDKLRMQGVTIK